jgi:LmbE family N-acetylglucosaminyl deacetylase
MMETIPLNLVNQGAEIFVPDGSHYIRAVRRTTHLGIGAHQDDLENIAVHGILNCYQNPRRSFSGVVLTDGAGAPRPPKLQSLPDLDYVQLRNREQKAAARLGEYSAAVLLAYSSPDLKDFENSGPTRDLQNLIRTASARVVYTHNPFDRHPTHQAAVLRTLRALQTLPSQHHPERLYGVEFWRNLDWLDHPSRVTLDCSQNLELQADLLGVYETQNAVKDYPRGSLGRRRAQAVFAESHQPDQRLAQMFAVDLTPLLAEDAPSLGDFARSLLESFQEQVLASLADLHPPD